MPRPSPDWNTIFAWMVEKQTTPQITAEHFGLSGGTMRPAVKREIALPGFGRLAGHQLYGKVPPPTPKQVQPNPLELMVRARNKQRGKPDAGTTPQHGQNGAATAHEAGATTPPAPPPLEYPKIPLPAPSPGRKTHLTPALAAVVLEAISVGATDRIAFGAAGISEATFYQWIEKGTDRPMQAATDTTPEVPARVARSPYREFVEALQIARERFKLTHLQNIVRHAQGTVITHYAADGKTVASVEQRADGDWKASKHLLAIKDPENFSERRILEQRHTNATGQGPVVVATGGDLAAAIAELAKLPEEVRDALAGVGGGLAPDNDG